MTLNPVIAWCQMWATAANRLKLVPLINPLKVKPQLAFGLKLVPQLSEYDIYLYVYVRVRTYICTPGIGAI